MRTSRHSRAVAASLTLLLFVGLGVLTAVRWNVWFVNPPEPVFRGDTLAATFHGFADDSVPGFVATPQGWQDLNSPDSLCVLVLGDVHNTVHHAQWDSLAIWHPQTDVYAQLGDFVERGYFYYYQQLLADLRDTRFDSIPLVAVPGNHEYQKGLVRTLDPLWMSLFHNPDNGPVDFPGTTCYVDFPHLRLITIDTNGLQRLHHFTRVSTWLHRVLDSAGGRFTVVLMHHPVYSCSAGRQNMHIYAAFRHVLGQADLVFAGHDHNYARRLPFVDTNSAAKYYIHTVDPAFERVGAGLRLYQLLTVTADTLTMETRLLETGELYDGVRLIRQKDGGRCVVTADSLPEEVIQLPERYRNDRSLYVRRFLNRRDVR